MPILLPLAALVLITAIFHRRRSGLRFALISAATILGAFVVTVTEVLSALHALIRTGICVAWALLVIALLLVSTRLPRGETLPTFAELSRATRRYPVESALIAAGATIAALVFVTAVVSPPNTWDALDYHLSRMVMWIQNQSVELFPTADYARLISPPWSEYSMLHLELLWNGDRFVNLVQWACFVGSALAVSCIAKDLGAGIRGQTLAAFLALAIPQGVLEASGAMNSCCAAFWITVSAVFMVRFAQSSSTAHAMGAGAAVGLALLTKGTCHVLLPLVLLSLWLASSPTSHRALVRRAPMIILVVIALNAAHGLREFRFTGSPLGLPFPEGGPRLHFMNDRISISGTISTFFRNVSLHAATPAGRLNRLTERAVKALVRLFGADPNDPANTWLETRWFTGYQLPPTGLLRHEVFAGNPVHMGLTALAGWFLIRDRVGALSRATKWLAAGIAASFILFCALLRWQIWGARLQLPVFVLGCAVLGVVLAQHLSTRILVAVSAVVLLLALNCAVRNSLRPLSPWSAQSVLRQSRAVTYFADGNEDNAVPWMAAAERVRRSRCRTLGLDEAVRHFYDYPLLELVGADTRALGVRFVGVDNLSAQFLVPGLEPPCLVACMGCAQDQRRADRYRSTLGEGTAFGDLVLFGAD